MFLKVIIISLFTALLISCASAPKNYKAIELTQLKLDEANQNTELKDVAAITLYQAQEQLDNATSSISKNDVAAADHYVYLANRKMDLANELFLKSQLEKEHTRLKKQHHEMIAHSRRIETKRSRERDQIANQKIKQLELELGEYKAEETSRGTLLIINDLLFDPGGFNLRLESQIKLEPIVRYLFKNSTREIIIEGHTDSLGNAELNKNLSLQRSNAVKKFLVEKGIHETRIESRGFGEEVPIATNETNTGRKLNRRVEIIIKAPKE